MQGVSRWGWLPQWVLDGAEAEQARTVKQLLVGVGGWPTVLDVKVMVLGVWVYLAGKPILKAICRGMGTTGKSTTFKGVALIHNIALCVYSLWTSVNVWRLTTSFWREHGYEQVMCGHGLWERGLNVFGLLFYVSKYWELIDTVLLIWKGRAPSFLQVYHHAVTIVCAHWLQTSHAAVMFLFVGLNATVHTVMYAYYALTIVGVRLKAKWMITMMQMVQFCVGTLAASPTFFLRAGKCAVASQKMAVGAIMAHAVILTYLFAMFFRQTYRPSKQSFAPSQPSELFDSKTKSQ